MDKGIASIIIEERRQWARKLEERDAVAKALEEEIRQLKERVADLEGEHDWPVPECIRARSRPVTAVSARGTGCYRRIGGDDV